jgi:hypothetical protein
LQPRPKRFICAINSLLLPEQVCNLLLPDGVCNWGVKFGLILLRFFHPIFRLFVIEYEDKSGMSLSTRINLVCHFGLMLDGEVLYEIPVRNVSCCLRGLQPNANRD